MRTLKQRIISVITVLLIVMSAAFPTYSVYSEETDKASITDAVEEVSTEAAAPKIENSSDEDTEYSHQSLEVYPDKADKKVSVTLEGLMPVDATATVVDVTEETDPVFSDASATDAISEDQEVVNTVLAAYDITIMDGDDEYQPDEDRPVSVQINDPRISSDSKLHVWHIKDDGTKEEIEDFTVEDGSINFEATGFSVYEIVEDVVTPVEVGDLFELLAQYGTSGLDVSYVASNKNNASGTPSRGGPYYIFNEIIDAPNNRKGIKSGRENESVGAAKLYFEKAGDDPDKYYIYMKDNNEDIQYLEMYTGNFGNNDRAALRFAASDNLRTLFTIEKHPSVDRIRIQATVNGRSYFWIRNGNDPNNIMPIVGYKSSDAGDQGTVWMEFDWPIPDALGLDGKTYGLMAYEGGGSGNALMAEGTNNQTLVEVTIRPDGNAEGKEVYVNDESDVTMWTFEAISGDKYYVKTTLNGETKYLQITDSGIAFTSGNPTENNEIKVTEGSVGNFDSVMLSSGGYTLVYDGSQFISKSPVGSADKAWLTFVNKSTITYDDLVSYSAEKISVSLAEDQESYIVYTRVWNSATASYDYYAIDHDGSLVQCYERGSDIMWVGKQINTLLWKFTVYYYEDSTRENNYYELQNEYSGLYLAPQLVDNQILSENTLGINLPGRRDGAFYSNIQAWDQPCYDYAAIIADVNNNTVISVPLSQAQSFYFAKVNELEGELTEVSTIDNNMYGITMKMKDITGYSKVGSVDGDRAHMSAFLGDNSGGTGSTLKQGLLSTNLGSDGYPTVVNPSPAYGVGSGFVANASLGDLYSGASTVNHLFLENTYNVSGYFEYDSSQNFAMLENPTGSTSDFIVYKELGTMDKKENSSDNLNRPSLKHGQFMPYNTIDADTFAIVNPRNLYDAKTNELPESDPRKYEKLHLLKEYPNYYNVMEMSASFVQTPGGKDAWGNEIIFEFTGDDDFWMYVDGELVLDLGGIHSAVPGTVNFSTGEVVEVTKQTTLRDVFEKNYLKRNPGDTAGCAEYLSQFFEDGSTIFKEYTSHEIRIFYMERGAGASNLHMRLNLSYVSPTDVLLNKKVTGPDSLDYNLVQYPYQIYYEDSNGEHLLTNDNQHINVTYLNSAQQVTYESSYTPPGGSTTYQSVYFINPEQVAEIHFPDNIINYRIVECGMRDDVYDQVKINGVVSPGVSDPNSPGRTDYNTGTDLVENRPNVTFENHIDPDKLRTLSIEKILKKEGSEDEISFAEDDTTFNYRLSLSNGIDDSSLSAVSMLDYHVKDDSEPVRYFCIWDSQQQKFIKTNWTDADYATLTDDEKDSITFQTSMNGAISMIPAGYVVEVPNIPVGTEFLVEERVNEIPTGYRFDSYARDGDEAYHQNLGDTVSSGWVRANEDPDVQVINRRGYELEAEKIWSDAKYTTAHGDIYTAVFIDGQDTPVPGTIRKVNSSSKSRHYIPGLAAGKTLDDYKIYEVKLTGTIVVDSTTNEVTSYGTCVKVDDTDTLTVDATSKSTGTTQAFDYKPSYVRGTAKKTSELMADGEENIRKDTVTNTRTGGIKISLYDMTSRDETDKTPLAGGVFTLEEFDPVANKYVSVGQFTSDSDGKLTVLYDYKDDTNYKLTELSSPQGFIGLENPVIFKIVDNNGTKTISFVGSDENEWKECDVYPADNTESLDAYVNIYNKPFILQFYKCDKTFVTTRLQGAEFALYRGLENAFGDVIKDEYPHIGHESLITSSLGIVPKVNETLPAGAYYLTEKNPPAGYHKINEDIVFEITKLGVFRIIEAPTGVELDLDDPTLVYEKEYKVKIPNDRDSKAVIVKKFTTGNFGNKNKKFNFTFVIDEPDENGYAWILNGIQQSGKIHSGDQFQLSHNESVTIFVPEGSKINITEASENYTPYYSLNGGAQVQENPLGQTEKYEVLDDTELVVTNELKSLVPTGVYADYKTLLLFGAGLILAILVLMYKIRLDRLRRQNNRRG